MAKCLRCKAGDEWIQGDVKEPKGSLRSLLRQQNKLQDAILAALKREHPVGSHVTWTHGNHVQRGEVLDHWWSGGNANLRARNTRTGKIKRLTAGWVHYEETGEHL